MGSFITAYYYDLAVIIMLEKLNACMFLNQHSTLILNFNTI